MKIRNGIAQWLGCLALLVGIVTSPAWGQGSTPQTLTWSGTTNEFLALNLAHPLSATASSGLPVTLRVEAGPAVLGNGSITVTNLGTVWVTAEQAGDATYASAKLARSFNVRQVVLSPVGHFDTGALARNAQAVGKYLYVGTFDAGLQILDVSNPQNPVKVGQYNTGGGASGVQVVGNLAYVTASLLGVLVLDVSDPSNPVRVGKFDTEGDANGVQIVGNYAYVADGDAGLQVLDVSNPANPIPVGRYDTPGNALRVQVVGHYAYVADLDGGLQVIDVSNATAPVRVGEYDTSNSASDVRVDGNFAYVTYFGAGLKVFDVHNSTAPFPVGGYDTPGVAVGLWVADNYAFVADLDGLQVLDVSDPAHPLPVGRQAISGEARGVQVIGNYAYIVGGNAGLQIYELKRFYAQSLAWQGTSQEALALNVTYPLTATASSGLPVTLRVLSGPAVIADDTITVTALGDVQVVAEQAGDALYLPTQSTRSFNVRRAVITPTANYVTYTEARDVRVAGNYAYLATAALRKGAIYVPGGLWVFDVSNPAKPLAVGQYRESSTNAFAVRVDRIYAYVAAGSDGLLIYNISDPTHLVRVGKWGRPGAIGVEVVNGFAFMLYGTGGLEVLDVRTPSSPSSIAFFNTDGEASGIQLVGTRAFVADGSAGLLVLDFSNLATLVRLSGLATGGAAYRVQVRENRAYVADGVRGLQVIDVGNPANPMRLGGYDKGYGYSSLELVGNDAFLADSSLGLQIIDIRNPANPIPVGAGNYETDHSPHDTRGLHVVGNYTYLADGRYGLTILQARAGFPQSLELKVPAEIPYPGGSIGSIGIATSGLPITFSVVSGPATIANNQLTLTGLGRVTLRGEQAGNAEFLPVSAEWSITVVPLNLGARLVATGVEIHWPAGIAGLQLQMRESLSPASPWQTITPPVQEVDGVIAVRVDGAASHRFFRLWKP